MDPVVIASTEARRVFFFDRAQRQLLSLMCADECGVVWPCLLKNGVFQCFEPFHVEPLRAEFAVVVEERRRRAIAAQREVVADDDDDDGSRAAKRRRTKR